MAKLLLWNETSVTEFILLGFSESCEVQILLFVLFLLFYLVALAGNTLLLITVSAERSLHTPMYFFLGNLSFLEICYTTNIFPCMLASFLTEAKSISFSGCMAQFYLFSSLGGTECLLLSMMSYDRYLAICNPLRYAAVMNRGMCLCLAAASWISGFVITLVTILFMSSLTFCSPNEIDHFFCDFSPLLKLACSDTYLFKKVSFFLSSTLTLVPFLLTVVSYIYILSAILNRPSTAGSQKAISTCSSHLIVVTSFYGTLIVMYVVPAADHSLDLNKVFSIFYTMVTPMVNPLIYSLRNREVREALKRQVGRKFASCWKEKSGKM
ncbi:olfactory receptor 6B2-like [Terrapene carolina triunguis]|uniref:olfactory receptor 6B2-like n=1 Tax=Terrapene triunguis TaxID=2587831 RepID=UPI000E7789CE|nr:olfactory receptor 6B2-like [Terrapene carolina triunguis]